MWNKLFSQWSVRIREVKCRTNCPNDIIVKLKKDKTNSVRSFSFLTPHQCSNSMTLCCTTTLLWKLVLSLEINKYLKVQYVFMACSFPVQPTGYQCIQPLQINQSSPMTGWLEQTHQSYRGCDLHLLVTLLQFNIHWIAKLIFFFYKKKNPHDLTFVNVPECHCMFALVFSVLHACIWGLSCRAKFE